MKHKPIRSALNEVLAQKRSSGAGGKHRSKAEKRQTKYKAAWKRGEE